MFCPQNFADILAAEAQDHDVETELVDLSECDPEDDLIVTVVNSLLVIIHAIYSKNNRVRWFFFTFLICVVYFLCDMICRLCWVYIKNKTHNTHSSRSSIITCILHICTSHTATMHYN